MINYRHLHYFLVVAKSGSLSQAADKLHLTPQTLSGQIKLFESRLGANLFQRKGRRLELTEYGQLALSYAEEIFQIGAELEQAIANAASSRTRPFRVGIADAVPKAIAHLLLAPGLEADEQVKLVCVEDRLERLAADLAIHKLDMVLADRSLPSSMDIKGYSHPLGECGVAFLAIPSVAQSLAGEFPRCLDGAPLLIPGEGSALRATLLRWLEKKAVTPRIVGEFNDSALMSAFGQAGAGVFPAPLTVAQAMITQFGAVELGHTQEIRERFFAISVERRLTHPAVVAVSDAARRSLSGKL